MTFEYIRALEPSVPACELELQPVFATAPSNDDTQLERLRTRALARAEVLSLACPAVPGPHYLDLPRFLGTTLADTVVEPQALAARSASDRIRPSTTAAGPRRAAASEPKPATEPRTKRRTLLGPGTVTMTLALAATLAFGLLVITQ